MIYRARIVVTMDGPPIENGAVAVSGNRVGDVGKFNEVSTRNAGNRVVDLGERALLPGLINAHCHLDYTGLRGKIPPQKSFADWIRAINAEKTKLTEQDYLAAVAEGFAEAKKFGTTTIANLTAFPEMAAKITEPIRTWWFAELIDVRKPNRAQNYVDLAVQSLKAAKCWGLAPHAPFTASSDLYRRCEEVARRENVLLTTHLAESHEEFSMFRDAKGSLYQFMESIGRDMSDCNGETPLGRFLGKLRDPSTSLRSARDDGWLVAHLNEIAHDDFDLLERSTGKFHVVHCPRSHKYFDHSRFPFQRLREIGFNICLGTDSLASNSDLSLFGEMRAFHQHEPSVSPREIFAMATTSAARALGKPHVLGGIRAGYLADLIAIPFESGGDVFEKIIAFDGPVPWLMIDGDTRDKV